MITGEYPPAVGGVADYTARLAHELRAQGTRVDVVTTCPTDGQTDASATVSGWTGRGVGELARLIRRTGPDLLHLQYQTAAYGMSPVVNALPLLLHAHGVRVPFITTFHDFRPPYLFPKAGPLRPLANHLLLGAGQAAIFVDPSDLLNAHPRGQTAWIPIGSNIAPLPSGDRAINRRRYGIGDEDLVLGFFGFINASKGVDVLLRAAARLIREGLPVRVLFVGDSLGASDQTNADTAAASLALAATLGIENSIIRTGRLSEEEVSSTLAAADLAVLPYVDGASLNRGSLLACLAQGLPTVTTPPRAHPGIARRYRVPPFDELGRFRIDGRIVALTPAGDDGALANTIRELAQDPAWRLAVGAAARSFAASVTWNAIVEAHSTFYQRVLAKGKENSG